MYSLRRYLAPITFPTANRRQDNWDRWVSPFGNRRISACSQLPDAYRSVPRPSSPVHAKASTKCSYLTLESPHHQRQRWAPDRNPNTTRHSAATGWTTAGRTRSAIHGVDVNSSQPCWTWLAPDPICVGTRSARPKTYKTECLHGIDLKNPFTMSNNARPLGPQSATKGGNPYLHPWISHEQQMVEPIGIEPMT